MSQRHSGVPSIKHRVHRRIYFGPGNRKPAPRGDGRCARAYDQTAPGRIVLNAGVAAVKATPLRGRPAGRALTEAKPPRKTGHYRGAGEGEGDADIGTRPKMFGLYNSKVVRWSKWAG